MRGLPLDTAVPAAHQSVDDFRAFVRKELAKEYPAEKATALQTAMLHVGLFVKPFELLATLEQTLARMD